jgi:hypothetical protein
MRQEKVNLIKNPRWLPGPSGGPEFFSGNGPITYDKLSIGGYRTCSITMPAGGAAQDFYEPLIPSGGKLAITFGFNIRTVDAEQISYAADFYDANRTLLSTKEKIVTPDVTYNFKEVNTQFLIPSTAAFLRLSIKFRGKITACTYWAPHAYYV